MSIKTIRLGKTVFSFSNWIEFLLIYKDIFILKEYAFKTNNKAPFIIDCGAHIGISVLFFKKLYPRAKIIVFEPNPRTYKLLKRNVKQNKLSGITLIEGAVSTSGRSINFYTNKNSPSWGDSIVINPWNAKNSKIKVSSYKLSTYITKPVDLLKLDIEGVESRVLHEIEHKLKYIKEIILEFHGSLVNTSNNLEKILSLLRLNSFSFEIMQLGRIKGTKIKQKDIKRTEPYLLLIYAKNSTPGQDSL